MIEINLKTFTIKVLVFILSTSFLLEDKKVDTQQLNVPFKIYEEKYFLLKFLITNLNISNSFY